MRNLQWEFDAGFPFLQHGWVMALVLAAGLAAVIVFYRRHAAVLPRRTLWGLTALRAGALLALVLLLFRPQLRYDRALAERPRIAIAVDDSLSMSVRDLPGLPDRLGRVRDYLSSSGKGRRADLSDDFEVELWTIGDAARPVDNRDESLLKMEPKCKSTLIAQGLAQIESAPRAEPPLSRILLFTDGVDTAGGLAGPPPKTPVLAISAGTRLSDAADYRDILIQKAEPPRTASLNTLAEVRVDVEAFRFPGARVEVWLADAEDKVLDRKPLVLDDRPGPQEVVLHFKPEKLGPMELKARVTILEDERIRENNTATFTVNVTEPRIRVLYMESNPRNESRELYHMLSRDPNVALMRLDKRASGEFFQSPEDAQPRLKGFPDTLETLKNFDVIILGDLDATHYAPAALGLLDRWVEAGGGLVMICGGNSFGAGGFAETPLARLLPVTMGGRKDSLDEEPFRPRLTAAGRQHPVMTGIAHYFENPRMPQNSLRNRTLGARPGAEVLIDHPTAAEGGAPAPVLAVMDVGRGRTIALTAGGTYRWRAVGEGRSLYVGFWGALVRWSAHQDVKERATGPGMTLFADKPLYDTNEPVTLTATVQSSGGQAPTAAEVKAKVTLPGGNTETLNFGKIAGEPGAFQARFNANAVGAYKVEATASEAGTPLGKATVEFQAGRENQEFDRLDMDEAALMTLAEKTGGAYATLSEADTIIDRLRAEQKSRRQTVSIPDSWRGSGLMTGLFLVVAVLLGVEWWVRKRIQMP